MESLNLAIATVPYQQWTTTYNLSDALKEGTIFPELNLFFYLGGDCSENTSSALK